MLKGRTIKWLVLFMVMAVVFTLLAGCSNSSKGKEEGKAAGTKAVKVAFLGPLTGPNAMQGVGARNAFQLAIKQANDSGKLPFKIEVVDLDDASNPGTGASVAQKAVADPDVVAASGHWNSPVAEATIPIFKSAGVPLIIWGAIRPTLTSKENYPYITRVCPTQEQENLPLANFVVNNLGRKKWAVISDTTTYGKSNTEAWKTEIKKYPGAEIVSIDEIQVGQNDFRPILSKIKAANVDGVYFGGVVMEAALVRRQMVELGMKDTLMVGISGIVDDKFIETAGTEAAEGVIATKPGKSISKLEGGKAFEEAYQKAGFKEPYGAYGPYAYDAANIIVEALKQVGPDRKKLVDAIAKISYNGLLGVTTFNEVGQTTNVVSTIYVVEDGKWVDWDASKYKSGERKLPGAK
ncbi:Leu/Ile/Val-binding protein [Moorella glycerini]|uniref:Leucine-, isoleucine-, valine-, threonine-, and alanine-binding protein n=1 Tax=Neomoorella stamsii TaxID=1266720 RepID=A0A9X7J378_9FIRM|nr:MULTISPECIES: branched-chain amino acid ABC transporter substrate-binding protein [Moorella]PRR73445.1 Leucine-, isoleucine-, valine-, threonine-, and alanine-binding protein precursor [Moorella stamsii]CEP69214.1 Leu/Ile/Val-binding protein [Moorella glycerini]